MALIAKHYTWNRQELDPYAKIISKEISGYRIEDVKKYKVKYIVHIFTTEDRSCPNETKEYEILDIKEDITIEELYENLKSQYDFLNWINN